jgi:hypothetical protein
LVYDSQADLEVEGTVTQTLTISSNYETYSLNGYDVQNGHDFTVTKKINGQNISLYADLRYWPAFGSIFFQSSGAYIFRVQDGVTENLRYSHFQGLINFNTSFLSQVTFYYYNTTTKEFARIVMRVYRNRPASEWVLKLGSIPLSSVG